MIEFNGCAVRDITLQARGCSLEGSRIHRRASGVGIGARERKGAGAALGEAAGFTHDSAKGGARVVAAGGERAAAQVDGPGAGQGTDRLVKIVEVEGCAARYGNRGGIVDVRRAIADCQRPGTHRSRAGVGVDAGQRHHSGPALGKGARS